LSGGSVEDLPNWARFRLAQAVTLETRAKLKAWFFRLLRNDLVHNSTALYGVQLCRKIFPLVTMPYLVRVLGPSVWGSVAFVSSLGEFIVLLIEFGFNLSATREIAQSRHLPRKCSSVMAGVVGAQVLLATASVSAAWLASRYIPLLRDNPHLLWAGVFYGVFQGINPLWFFQGLERLRLAAFLEIAGKTLGVLGVFVFVRSSSDAWEALMFQGVPPMLSSLVGLVLAYRQFPFTPPTVSLVKGALISGWRLFVFRSGESLYGAGNAFILGLFAPSSSVGYFAIAEKISKAAFGLLNPIREALYPRISRLAVAAAEDAARLVRIGAAIMISGGLVLGFALYVLAPQLIRLMTGSDFPSAVTVLRIFAFLPPLLSVTYSIGLQWLLPFGEDGTVNRIILTAGALNLVIAFSVAPVYQHIGMAVSVLISEIYVCISMVLAVVAHAPLRKDRMFQRSKLAALAKGAYDG
jgi:PST family polysaccharide transporter